MVGLIIMQVYDNDNETDSEIIEYEIERGTESLLAALERKEDDKS